MEAILPPVLPPTYRGQYTRCVYMATVGYNIGDSDDMQTLHVPFKVNKVLCLPCARTLQHSSVNLVVFLLTCVVCLVSRAIGWSLGAPVCWS